MTDCWKGKTYIWRSVGGGDGNDVRDECYGQGDDDVELALLLLNAVLARDAGNLCAIAHFV